MKYFLIVLVSLLFISCSKNNDSGGTPVVGDSTCQIVSVKWVLGTDSLITNLSYNSDGKLSKTENNLGVITSYTYSGNQIYITNNDNPISYDTTTLNNFGYVAQINVHEDLFVFTSPFYYTADTVLSYTIFNSPLIATPDTSTYHFSDGDLTSIVSGNTTNNYTYYPDKSEQPADLSFYNQMVGQGALGYKNKHLTKGNENNSGSQEYSYIFDASGKIVSLVNHYVNSQSSGIITYYYTYACHL